MAFSLLSGAHTTRGALDLEEDVQSPQVNAHYMFGVATEESVVNAVDVDASLELLKCHSSSQKHAAHQLCQHLVKARLEMSTEAFERHQNEVYQRIFLLLRGPDVNERLGAVAALDELIKTETTTPFAEIEQLVKISNNLSDALRTNSDRGVLVAVSHALGCIARLGSMPNLDFMREYEINRGLEWLQEERSHQRLAACLVLKEMAMNAPAAFYVHISAVFDGVAPLLVDKDRNIREAVANVLGACLSASAQRGGQFYLRWHCRCFDMIIHGLKNTSERNEPATHGALLTASEMMKRSGNFIIPRFKELCDAIMNLLMPGKKNKSNLIRSQLIEILPQVANIFPDAFGSTYPHLRKVLDYLTYGCTVSELRGISFLALGQLSLVIPYHLSSCLGEVVAVVKEGLSPINRRKGFKVQSKDALTCLANLVVALGSEMEEYIADLTPAMFSGGLSPSLIDTLVVISQGMPTHKAPLQKWLLLELSLILSGKPYIPPGKVAPWVQKELKQELLSSSSRHSNFHSSVPKLKPSFSFSSRTSFSSYASGCGWVLVAGSEEGELSAQIHDTSVHGPSGKQPSGRTKGEGLLVLALHTLGGYKIGWDGICLLPLVKDCIVKYIRHNSLRVRKAAALCCCQLLVEPSSSTLTFGPSVQVVEWVLKCLLQAAVADSEPGVRQTIIRALDPRFDRFLCQAHHLKTLFLLVGDADFAIRSETISLLGRLVVLNPAYILPSLRPTLLYLVVELQYNSMDTNARVEAMGMICRFLTARSLCHLALPLLDAIVSALPIGAQSTQLATAALETLGRLCVVAKGEMAAHFDKLMPILFESIMAWSYITQREAGLRTFGRFITACECVGRGRVDFPLLLPSVISIVTEGTFSSMPWSFRREALRTLGILGALEPYLYRQIEGKDKEQRTNGAVASYTSRSVGGTVADGRAVASTTVPSRFALSNKKEENTLIDESGGVEIESQLPMDRTERSVNMVVLKDKLYVYGIKEGWTYEGTATQSASCAMWEQCTPQSKHLVVTPQAKLAVDNIDYYPTVTIEALMDMLTDSSLDAFNKSVLGAIGTIFKSLGIRCVHLLRHVIPNMIHVGRNCEPGLREVILHNLGLFAGMVMQHLRPFLPELFELIIDYWNDNLEQVIVLMKHMVINLRESFAPFAPRLLPLLLHSLALPSLLTTELASMGTTVNFGRQAVTLSDGAAASRVKLVVVLKNLPALRPVMTLYVHVIIPALIKLISTIAGTGVSPQATKLLKLCVSTLGSLISFGLLLQHPSSAAQLVYPLAHVMDVWVSSKNGSGDSVLAELQDAILEVFCSMAVQLGPRYLIFDDCHISERFNSWFPPPKRTIVAGRYSAIVATIRENANGGGGQQSSRSSQSMIGSQGGCTMALLKLLGEPARTYLGTCDVAEHWGGASLLHGTSGVLSSPDHSTSSKQKLHLHNLRVAWNVTQRRTHEDWMSWVTYFRVVLLRESPNPQLRGCCALAQAYPPIGERLFHPAFVSCWLELDTKHKDDLILSLKTLFRSPGVPTEVLHVILNLAEFMEKEVDPLPLNVSELSKLASRCNTYAKALHFQETQFQKDPTACIEDLIFINKKLDNLDAAKGILKYASKHLETGITVEASWLAEVGQWHDALGIFKEKLESDPSGVTSILGCMRCMDALGDWGEIIELYDKSWPLLEGKDDKLSREIEALAVGSSWLMSDWDRFSHLVKAMEGSSVEKSFFHAVLAVHERDFERCELHVDMAQSLLENQFTSLLMESYNRAYSRMVTIQQLTELEEIVEYLKAVEFQNQNQNHIDWTMSGGGGEQSIGESDIIRLGLISRWDQRLEGAAPDERVWKNILILHSLILEPTDDIQNWLHVARLCQQNGNFSLSRKVLGRLQHRLAELPAAEGGVGQQKTQNIGSGGLEPGVPSLPPQQGIKPLLHLAFLEHKWIAEEGNRQQTLSELRVLTDTIHVSEVDLKVRCLLRLGQWELKQSSLTRELSMGTLTDIASKHKLATGLQKDNYQAWQSWAMINLRMSEHQISRNSPELPKTEGGRDENKQYAGKLERQYSDASSSTSDHFKSCSNRDHHNLPIQYLVNAAEGFLRAIALGRYHESALVQENMLHLISILFTHGHIPEVHAVLSSGLATSSVDSWLCVLPQLIARINIKHECSRAVLHSLLDRLGRHHPQALVYPMCVALKSPRSSRREAATMLIANLQQYYAKLVSDTLLVSDELVNVAILLHEHCHESLEEASRRYFKLGDVHGMLSVLLPMHSLLQSGAKTEGGHGFLDRYGEHLEAAYKCLISYIDIMKLKGLQPPTNTSFPLIPPLKASHKTHSRQNSTEMILVEAWNIYFKIFRDIKKQLTQMTTLELRYVSPQLLAAHDLELVVPGTYKISGSGVRIKRFLPIVHLIPSKQRPRKFIMKGEDGKDYCFLLKGREDLRQDERVMQLFGHVNAILAFDQQTMHDLSIERYCVVPLSHNAGLLGWVPNTDTLHSLVREYRECHKIMLDIEHRFMIEAARPCEYDSLTTMQKVEIFNQALETTPGHDINRILWLKSENSEAWLIHRTNYIRSLAVMSMAGYILGLGDRHPSNLMLNRVSGKILHIDFGDCFEIAMHRDKFPEKVPFRLTRMLCNAMEVSGVEGTYRATCERVMVVLRNSSDSLLAMLEAFVYDPLISWRFLGGPVEEDVEGKEDDSAAAHSKEQNLPPPLPCEQQQQPKKKGTSEDGKVIPAASHGGYGPISNNTSSQPNGNFEEEEEVVVSSAAAVVNKSMNPSPPSQPKWPCHHSRVPKKSTEQSSGEDEGVGGEIVEENKIYKKSNNLNRKGGPIKGPNMPHQNTDVPLEVRVEIENQEMLDVTTVAPLNDDGDVMASHKQRIHLSREQMANSFVAISKDHVSSPGRENKSIELHLYNLYDTTQGCIDRETSISRGKEGEGVPPGALGGKGLKIISRVQDKLSGNDFGNIEPFTVKRQVERLISEATSAENLSQLFSGWCSFW